MSDIVKSYKSTKCIRGVVYEYEDMILADGTRTSRCLGRVTKDVEGSRIPQPVVTDLRGDLRGSNAPLESDGADSPGDCEESPPGGTTEALRVGRVVHHRLNRELMGRIVWLDTDHAQIELLSWPTDWWRQWGTRPVPVLVGNLELLE